MKKNCLKSMVIILAGSFLVGCEGKTTTTLTPDTDPNYYDAIEERAKFDLENELNIAEDMNGGLDSDTWWAVDGYWDAGSITPHNGVRSRNLYYTQNGNDNYLAIRGRGKYNEGDPSTKNLPEGAVIISKNHLIPGRYEIEMAAFPRFGGCSAMWTYCTTTGNEATSQNEIDIEIGGEGQFTNEWCTTWTTHTNKRTENVDVRDITYLNDGKIHKYTFDWYTDYANTGEKRIDWFIDGQFVVSITGDAVPEHATPLWVGCWFPSWAGDSLFYEDYMLVKSINFTAFDASQYYEDCRAYTSFNLFDVDTFKDRTVAYSDIINLNKLSNGDFSNSNQFSNNNYYGWEIDGASKGTVEFSSETENYIRLNAGTSDEEYHGEYLKQTIGGAYPGYQYEINIDAALVSADSVGNIEIYYKDAGSITVSKEIIPITSTTSTTYSKTITMPERSANLEIDITAEDGSVIYSNASVVYKR